MSLPMMTFSFSPSSESDLAWIAASVSTLVVSWNEAADSHESVAREALVMPIRTGRPEAGVPLSSTTDRLTPSNLGRSTSSPGSSSVSPDSSTFTRFSICRMMISMCLSWIDTPWDLVRDLLRAVVGNNGDLAGLLRLLELDPALDLADRRHALGNAGLEELLDARQAMRDVLACHAAGVEGPHGQLRARLADRLGRDDPDRLADVHPLPGEIGRA